MKRAIMLSSTLAFALASGCIQLRIATNGSGREVPQLAVSEGMSATVRKPRGTGLVVGVVFDLDAPAARR